MTHPIENIVRITMENLDHIAKANTVVGEAVKLEDGSLVMPVSRVTLGFVTGGGEYDSKHTVAQSGHMLDERPPLPFLGTSAAGVGLAPVAFLCVRDGRVSVLPASTSGALDRLVGMLPELLQHAEQIVKALPDNPNHSDNKERCK